MTSTDVTRTEVTHQIDVAAPAEAVYRIVADVSRWPLYFPPTVHAERVAGDDTEERIRICALANGDLRSWESRRRLFPDRHRVEFEQVVPADPVAAMGGAWTVRPNPGGGCVIVLDHHYRALGDDPANLARIASAVETNSVAELANLKRVAERAAEEPELLFEFADTVTIAGPVEAVYDFLYDAARWPERLPHVARLDLREDTPGLQHMEMDTRSPDGSLHTTVSGRVCEPNRRISYKQVKLPAALRAHNGEWLFESTSDGQVTVTARHQVFLDPEGIAALPNPPESLAAARTAVRNALGANSRATLAKAREHVEAR
ncbi:aromatase/cyclase [Crossiella sp. SN42]|uniref:aromatase/cyclase n=1 Tax=Crossiella sp. SN42 TaxID=2944808 RepID=UPI00207D0AAC|nr:aromatase/cyclase [Crossiella sp. SN42]MCO1576044.1 aromatase/cyclase [Crossiella sp. SN42]